MIRCFLPKDVGTVCTRILGAWVHNKKQHINDNISFVPSSHWFFHLSIISLGPSRSVISFFDIWHPARERHFFFFLVWKALSIRTWLSRFVTQIPEEKSGTSVWIKNGTDVLALGAFTSAKSKPILLMLRGQRSGFKGPAGLAPGCVGSTSLSLWNMGESSVSLGLSFFRHRSSLDLMGRDLLPLPWCFLAQWCSILLFALITVSRSWMDLLVFQMSKQKFRNIDLSRVRGWINSRIGGEMEPGSVCPALLPGCHSACGMPLPVSVNGNGSALGIWGNAYQLGAQDCPLFSDFHLFLPLWPLKTKRHVLGNTWLCNMFFWMCLIQLRSGCLETVSPLQKQVLLVTRYFHRWCCVILTQHSRQGGYNFLNSTDKET